MFLKSPIESHKLAVSIVRIAISICVLTGIAACTETASPTATPPPPTSTFAIPTKPAPPEDWQTRWLKGVPCSPPCWEGITPGQTSRTEAEQILAQSPLIASTKIYTSTIPQGSTWKWTQGDTSGGSTYYNQEAPQTVYGIWPAYRTSFTFRDIINAYGEPSHIMARGFRSSHENRTYSQVWIVFLSKGFALSTEQKDLSENTDFSDLTFFAPTLDGFVKVEPLPKLHPDWLVPWQGFKGFDYYCHDESSGKECREAHSY